MKKTVFIFFIALSFFSCSKKDQCGNDIDVSGVYENKFEKGATNYLILNNDGTFEQKYKKGDTIKVNKGKWEYNKEQCRLKFNTLKVLHNIPYNDENSENIPKMRPVFRRSKILFYEDLPFEYDYVKILKKIE